MRDFIVMQISKGRCEKGYCNWNLLQILHWGLHSAELYHVGTTGMDNSISKLYRMLFI